MQKVDKEKTRYYLAKIHILFRGNFRTQAGMNAYIAKPVEVSALRSILKTILNT